MFLNMEKSMFTTCGPLKAFRPRLPNAPEGTPNAHGPVGDPMSEPALILAGRELIYRRQGEELGNVVGRLTTRGVHVVEDLDGRSFARSNFDIEITSAGVSEFTPGVGNQRLQA